MNDQYVRNVIEAALLAAGRPLTADELVSLFDERDGFNAEEVHAAIAALRTEYETRGIELIEMPVDPLARLQVVTFHFLARRPIGGGIDRGLTGRRVDATLEKAVEGGVKGRFAHGAAGEQIPIEGVEVT